MGTDWLSLKEEGNSYFKSGAFTEAIASYTNALEQCPDKDKCVLYKNRSACYLKLDQYTETVDDTTNALKIEKGDIKALYRRCQALEALEKLEDAYKDAQLLIQLEPRNAAVQETLRRLRITIQSKIDQSQSTSAMIDDMMEAILKPTETEEKKSLAMKNLAIYAHQPAGREYILKNQLLGKLISPVMIDAAPRCVAVFKIVHGLCEGNMKNALQVCLEAPLNILKGFFLKFEDTEDVATNFMNIIATILTSLCEYFKRLYKLEEKDEKAFVPVKEFNEKVRVELEKIPLYRDSLIMLVSLLGDLNISAKTRDIIVDTFIKAIQLCKAVADFVMENKGVKKLLELASTSCYPKMKVESQLRVTSDTAQHVSVALSFVYEYVYGYDKERTKFEEEAKSTISRLLHSVDKNNNLQGLTALACLFQANRECAQTITHEDDISRVLVITCFEGRMFQLLGAETLAYAATDKKICGRLATNGMDILKMLYKSTDHEIQVRGLVALSKVCSKGGGNVNEAVMMEGGALKLYDACRKYVKKTNRDFEFKKWVCEALAYLTCDAEVKEILVDDKEMISLLVELAVSEDSCITYAVCNAFANLANAYDKKKVDPEMLKLAEYAKQPIPKEHEMDGEEYVKNRIEELISNGLIPALVSLCTHAKTGHCQEQVARVFHAVVSKEAHRGTVIAQGGVKVLLPLTEKGTEQGMDAAAQAIAKIGITCNPALAFPGQRAMEVVRPLVKLIGFQKESLQQFEACMALTNLTAMNNEVRKRVMKESGFRAVETLMFDQDPELKRTATECMCNLVLCEEAFNMFKDFKTTTERLKLVMLYCAEEPIELQSAAAGTLAILTQDLVLCKKLVTFKSYKDIIRYLVTSDNKGLQTRGLFVLANLMTADKDIAGDIYDDDLFKVIPMLEKSDHPDFADQRKEALRCMKAARDWKLLQEESD